MKKFKKVYIEITNVCNLKCNFCPKTCRHPKYMSIEEFEFIINQVKEFTDYIYMHVKGEPLLHPNLSDFLDIAYKNAIRVNITTNGVLLKKNKAILLSKPGLRQLNISLHSLEQNEWIDDKQEYMDNIFDFIDEAKSSNLIVALRLWNLSQDGENNIAKNKYILDSLEEKLKLDYSIADEFTKKRGIKIRERLYLNEDIEFSWPALDSDFYDEQGFCYGLRDQLGILVDGTVIPCCLDGEGKINLGNIFDSKLLDILDTNRVQDIYDNFSNRCAVEELCKRCGYKNKFNK